MILQGAAIFGRNDIIVENIVKRKLLHVNNTRLKRKKCYLY